MRNTSGASAVPPEPVPGQPNSGGTDPGDLFPGRPLRRAVPGGSDLRAWLYTIARNVFLDQARRKRNTEIQLPGAAGHGGVTLTEVLEDREEALGSTACSTAWRSLYKEVFHLRVFGELPFGDIARVFGRTESWARVTFYRAKQKIIAGLEEEKHGGWTHGLRGDPGSATPVCGRRGGGGVPGPGGGASQILPRLPPGAGAAAGAGGPSAGDGRREVRAWEKGIRRRLERRVTAAAAGVALLLIAAMLAASQFVRFGIPGWQLAERDRGEEGQPVVLSEARNGDMAFSSIRRLQPALHLL